MSNPLIQMKQALERIMLRVATPENIAGVVYHSHMDAKSALSALESSGWNLEAIPELIRESENFKRSFDRGFTSSNDAINARDRIFEALAKLKEKRE